MVVALILFGLWNGCRIWGRWQAIQANKPADLIAPFVIVGKESKDGRLGNGMAKMLQSQVSRVATDLDSLHAVFDASQRLPSQSSRDLEGNARALVSQNVFSDIVSSSPDVAKTLPLSLFEAPEFATKVKGIDVGPMVRWAYDRLNHERILRITVQYAEQRAIISGNLGASWDSSVILETSSDDSAVIERITNYIWKRELETTQPHVAALKEEEFKDFAQALREFNEIRELEAAGRFDLEAWKQVAKKTDRLTSIIPNWPDLHLLSAATQLRALNFEQARSHYERARELIAKDNTYQDKKERLDAIDVLLTNLKKIDLSRYVAKAVADAEQRLLERLRVAAEDVDAATPVKVAVAGGLPPTAVLEYQAIERVGTAVQSDESYYDDDLHTGNVARMIPLVAGNRCTLLFAAMTGKNTNIALANNVAVLRKAKPDVIAVAYGTDGPLPPEVMKEIAKCVEDGIIVILPVATNKSPGDPRPVKIINTPVVPGATDIMIVGGVDAEGRRADFSGTARDVYWLPATGIPSMDEHGMVVFGKGVSYAVGLAGGVVARLKSKFPSAKPEDILRAIRDESSPIVPDIGEAKAVVNVGRATDRLKANAPKDPAPTK